jgi:hypothetical protein
MRKQRYLVDLTVFLMVLGTGASVALATADQRVWSKVSWHQERYRGVADYLDAHSRPEARIFVWGNSPEIYLYARRRMATRYMSINYQTGHVWGAPSNDLDGHPDLSSVPSQSWDNLMTDLERNRPTFIVDAAAGKLDKMDAEPIVRHPRMHAFVRRHYRLDKTVLGVPIYRVR